MDYSPQGRKESDTTEQLHTYLNTYTFWGNLVDLVQIWGSRGARVQESGGNATSRGAGNVCVVFWDQ